MSEQTMTAGELLDLLDIGIKRGLNIQALQRARAAVAELAQENERLKTRLSAEENAHAELQARCFDSGMPTHTSIFDAVTALRRRVEELENGAWLFGQRYYCRMCHIETYRPGECRHEHQEHFPSGRCICKECGAELSPPRKPT